MKQKPDILLTLSGLFLVSLAISGFTTTTPDAAQIASEHSRVQYSVVTVEPVLSAHTDWSLKAGRG